MKFSAEERIFVDKLSAISGHSPNVIKDIFMSLMIATVLKMYNGEKEIHIPYLFKLDIDYDVKTLNYKKRSFSLEEKYKFKTSKNFHNLLCDIVSNKDTSVENFIKKEIASLVGKILDLNKSIPLMDEK